MTKSRNRSVLQGALILSFAGLLSKIISAGYRVPLQNLTGDLGFYIYQQVYPILGMALILSLYGFPAAISKLVSELEENRNPLSIPSFYFPVFFWLMGASGLIFLLGYTQAPGIAEIMGDEKLVPSIKASFFAFLMVPFVSLFRGVFQGKNHMAPTAVSQIVEQIFRVTIIITTSVLVARGQDAYSIGIGAAWGSISGAVGAALLLGSWLRKSRRVWTWDRWKGTTSYMKTIFFYGVFICLNYMLLLSLQLVDAFTLVPSLVKTEVGIDSARLLKGIFDRGQPLIQLGTVLASSIALALIPSVTRKRLNNDFERVESAILSAVKVTVMIAFGATAGLVFLFPLINEAFFQDSQGTGPLRMLMLVIVGSSISITMSSVLQGLDYVKQTALVVLGGLVVKTAGNLILIPSLGLYGSALASIMAVTFVLVGNVVILRQEISIRKWLSLPLVPIVFSTMGMVIGLQILSTFVQLFWFPDHRFTLLIYLLILTGVGAMIYLILLLRLGGFSNNEVEMLPFHEQFIKLLPKGMK
ncbi:putative polysaccharide biosynthesis protein [Halobacillus litoralis]|uniref:Polysaccharide biosynthesis protein n=1 Tax=Halobacillus litoralis TaxID=45668 RepID=A0A410MDD8_9BACI|nr:polysaccharide biosynthesis protein [Halobacillus litoralis]QAS52729.1 polysaccharide biosynthesis protein [Halobacillus litoralis]